MELPVVVAGVPSFFMAGPPPVVLPFMLSPVVVFDPAGPPAFEPPPAVFGDCANDTVLTSAKVAASPTIDLIFMFVSFRFCPYEAIRHQCVRSYARSEARWSGPAKCSKVNQTLQRKQHGGFR